MSIDLDRARSFMARHARQLDRRRFDAVTLGTADARAAVVEALGAYRNADGGYGWGLEPDLRAPESQPGGALHALKALVDAGPDTEAPAVAVLDWLAEIALPDGAVPFALPIADPAGCAPFWVGADPTESSLQITAAVAAQAHALARRHPAVRDHAWLVNATRYCFDAIRAIDEPPFAYVLSFALQMLDAASDTHPEAHDLLAHLGRFVPSAGAVPVVGGSEGETLRVLGYAPRPGRPVRELLAPDAVEADLDRLQQGQQPDGGWTVDYASFPPAAALEWRGHATVSAVTILRANGR
jgi:hypothetical protein